MKLYNIRYEFMYISKTQIRLVRVISIVVFLLSSFNNFLIAQQNSSEEVSKDLVNIQNYYKEVLEDNSTNYDALTNLGVIYQQQGDLENSLRFFKKATGLHPYNARAYHNLGILYSLMEKLDDAISISKKHPGLIQPVQIQ